MADYQKPIHEKYRRRNSRRIPNGYATNRPIEIRVGNRSSPGKHDFLQVSGDWDTSKFQRLLDHAVRSRHDANEPLIIAVDGYAEWLDAMFSTVINDFGTDPGETNIAVQKADNIDLPRKSFAASKDPVNPWSFVVDHMNVPEVYYWSVNEDPPAIDPEDINNFVFRMGGWFCGQDAYIPDRRIAVAIIYTKHDNLSRWLSSRFMFQQMYKKVNGDMPDMNNQGLCWLYLRLYDMFTDYDNITSYIADELDAAEARSKDGKVPVKLRTRSMHKQVDTIFKLGQYLRFHTQSFKKLARTKEDADKSSQNDPIWEAVDDAIENLDQRSSYLDSLKERFNNLIELEFNIENATQSDTSRFLTVLGTLFLPISFVASLFGFNSVNWSALLFLYIAIPIFIASAIFTFAFPVTIRKYQSIQFGEKKEHLVVDKRDYTLLGNNCPSRASVPRSRGGEHYEIGRQAHGDALGRQRRGREDVSELGDDVQLRGHDSGYGADYGNMKYPQRRSRSGGRRRDSH